MNNGTIMINTGIGFGLPLTDKVKKDERNGSEGKCPPLTASFDFALPIAGVPFTFGIIVGFKTESAWWYNNTDKEKRTKNVPIMPIGVRIAYHLPFNIPQIRFDSYALLTFGGSVFFNKDGFLVDIPPAPDADPNSKPDKATAVTRKFWWGIGGGARYFFLPYMGAYLEFGIGNVQNITFGLSFKI